MVKRESSKSPFPSLEGNTVNLYNPSLGEVTMKERREEMNRKGRIERDEEERKKRKRRRRREEKGMKRNGRGEGNKGKRDEEEGKRGRE